MQDRTKLDTGDTTCPRFQRRGYGVLGTSGSIRRVEGFGGRTPPKAAARSFRTGNSHSERFARFDCSMHAGHFDAEGTKRRKWEIGEGLWGKELGKDFPILSAFSDILYGEERKAIRREKGSAHSS